MKKILFKIWKFPGVSETFILAQIATAINAGYEVKILVKDNPEAINKSIHQDFINTYALKEKIIFEKLNIPKNKYKRTFIAFLLLVKNFWYARKIFRHFQSKNFRDLNNIFQFDYYKRFKDYDIIHVQFGTNAKPIDILKYIGLLKSKLIVSFHGHDLFFPINGIIKKEGYYDILFESADSLVANTPFLEDLLIYLGAPKEKVLTIPVGVDNMIFSPIHFKEKDTSDIRLISIGRLVKYKGHIFGIECVKKLVDRGYSICYTIVGDGKQRKVLEEKINDYDLKKYISLVGRKSQIEIRDLLREHHLFLMTSVNDPAYGVETQGLVTAEAQASGLPVVAFDSGGVKYTLKDKVTGFIVKEGDIKGMTDNIEKLINDPELRIKMGASAIKFINENYSQQHIDKVWVEEYAKLAVS